MPTYQPNIPTGTVPLDQDYLNLQGNFQQLNIAYGVDHIPFSDTSGVPPGGITGIHTIIHLQSKTTPAAIANIGQLFNSVVNDGLDTDTILYFLTGKGKLLQLTSNLQPTIAANGQTFMPGGLIYKWGTVAASSSSTYPVVFPTAFPANVFNIQITPFRAPSSPGSDNEFWVSTTGLSTSGFTIFNKGAHNFGFYWMAIGN